MFLFMHVCCGRCAIVCGFSQTCPLRPKKGKDKFEVSIESVMLMLVVWLCMHVCVFACSHVCYHV